MSKQFGKTRKGKHMAKAVISYAIRALRKLDETGAAASSITTTSCKPEKRYEVTARFRSLEEMQAFHQAMIECGRAVREIDEAEEAKHTQSDQPKGPFSQGTGGGKRNIRATKSLS